MVMAPWGYAVAHVSPCPCVNAARAVTAVADMSWVTAQAKGRPMISCSTGQDLLQSERVSVILLPGSERLVSSVAVKKLRYSAG